MSGEQVGEKEMCPRDAYYVLCSREWGVVQFCGCVLSPNESAWMVFCLRNCIPQVLVAEAWDSFFFHYFDVQH